MKTTNLAWILSALLMMLLLCCALIPAVSAIEKGKLYESGGSLVSVQIDPGNDVEGYLPVNVISFDPSIKNATPHWIILTINDDRKNEIVNSLDTLIADLNGANSATKDLLTLKDNLQEIWKKYPVTSQTQEGGPGYPTYGGTITQIGFTSTVQSTSLTEQENKTLEMVQLLLNEAYYRENPEGQMSVLWGGSPTHSQIAYWAADKCLFPYPTTGRDYAPEPDSWYAGYIWPFNELFHSLDHYYNPGAYFGGAPIICRDLADEAKSYYSDGERYEAAKRLGYASHFLTDVGNPMHTGRELEQILWRWCHDNYEAHVNARWNSQFESVVANNYDYYWYTDWSAGTRDLAIYSNGYLDTVIGYVYGLGEQWDYTQPHTTIDNLTNNLILRTAKYANGLARYVKS
ncbi:MAG: hypothetical protein QMD46_03720 [Methanomicrobiales archaeon]|nr:hypothetical protein [Methanomicrobiales archaeon]